MNAIDPTGMKEYSCHDDEGNSWSQGKINTKLGRADWCASDRENNTQR